jgi:hypothetical protein
MHGTVSTNHQHKISRLLGNIISGILRMEYRGGFRAYIGYGVSASKYVLYRTLCGIFRRGAKNIRDAYVCINPRIWQWQSMASRRVIESISVAP